MLDELGTLTLSAISWLEVLQGMRNKAELLAVKKMLDKRSARLLPVTEAITLRATSLAGIPDRTILTPCMRIHCCSMRREVKTGLGGIE